MANHKSALKRIRANDKKRIDNKYRAKTMRNSLRDFRALTEKEQAETKLPEMLASIDKLAKKKVIHKNKAANLKSQLMKKIGTI